MDYFDKLAKKIRNFHLKIYPLPVKILLLILIAIIFLIFSRNTVIYFNKTIPNLVLWVWERPENLYFMKKEKATYAYLAGIITKTETSLVLYFRQQPLRIPDNSTTIATDRIEDKTKDIDFGDSDIQEISDFVVSACLKDRKNINCQIDFDAVQSQIDFYKKLIPAVRSKLPSLFLQLARSVPTNRKLMNTRVT